MINDDRLILGKIFKKTSEKAVDQSLEIPAKDINNAVQLLKLQADAINQYSEVSHIQTSRLKFKILKNLEENLEAGMFDNQELMQFLSVLSRSEDKNVRIAGGLAEHLEAMYNETTQLIANDTMAKARKYEELEKSVIDISPQENGGKRLPKL
jgi:hypothetical protein